MIFKIRLTIRLTLFLFICFNFCFCKHQTKPVFATKPEKLSPEIKTPIEQPANFRNEELKQEFKKFKLFALDDTIKIDINGDGSIDKIFFTTKNYIRKMVIADGLSGKATTVGDDKSFIGMADNLDWIDFWGITNDKQTYEVIIKDNEIKGERKTELKYPSIFVRKDEVGGGIVTFKAGKYIWIHQSD